MEGKRLALVCGIITLIAAGLIIAFILVMSRSSSPPQTNSSPITASGTLTCLPHKDAGPDGAVTLECAIGLKTEDGRHYGLKDLSPQDSTTSFSKRVIVSGDLSPPEADDKYSTVGTITVDSFQAN